MNFPEISLEKFQFVEKHELAHDKKFETKPMGYFKGAFLRFCKNKGAIVAACVIIALVLFAIIVPFCTQYTVSYSDVKFINALPKSKLFAKTDFWDGCKEQTQDKSTFMRYYAMGAETGHNAVKNQDYSIETVIDEKGNPQELYRYRLDTYHANGCIYIRLSPQQYEELQAYQDANNVQIIYPTVRLADRPNGGEGGDGNDANYYYKTKPGKGGKTTTVYDENGNIIPVFWARLATATTRDGYTSKMRVEGADGFIGEDGERYFYNYARIIDVGYEVRVNYYEYYIYNHRNDGITEPYFLFGCDSNGRDILTCLASGARFSFLFAIAVAVVNMIVGAIYGSIEGYYGGKTDLIMERVSDILSAIPMMIVITLLKYHMGGSSHALILFLSFFLTGWIGMAGTTRMQFYRFKNQEYVLAARTLGAKDGRLMFKHIFPNAIGTLVTSCALVIPSMIYSETNLTYLGIINLSTGNITSVGSLIANGQGALSTAPHVAIFPSVFLVLLMLSFNLFGNGLRDAFNPSLRGAEG